LTVQMSLNKPKEFIVQNRRVQFFFEHYVKIDNSL
jgi:hypothetical protein